MRIALAFLFTLWVSVALATPAAINLGSANNTTSNSTLTVTVANNSPSGATVLLAVLHTNTGTTCSIGAPTDTAGNSYVLQASKYPNGNSTLGELCVWRVFNASALSSGNSITWTLAQGFVTAVAVSITGVLTSPLDVEDTGASSGGFCTVGTPLGAGITPTVNGDMLVGFCGWASPGTTTSDFAQDAGVAWAFPPGVNAYTANNIGIGGGSFIQPTAANIDYEPIAIGFTAEYLIALKASGGGGATSDQSLPLTGFGN